MKKYPKPVSKDSTKKIFEQMNNSIYKIKDKNGNIKTGFFSKVKYENKNIPVLIINYHIIKDLNYVIYISKNNKKIKVEFENLIYINEQYDITIIGIKEEIVSRINFLELDEQLYENNCNINYSDEAIYIIHYNKEEKDVVVSYGILNSINNSELYYSSNIESNIDISPIFNIYNNNIIGFHQKCSKYYNKGVSFKYFIDEFIKFNLLKNQDNEIEIQIDATNCKENEKIYFLSNYKYNDNHSITNYEDSLNELNKYNTELYINNKKCEFEKYFIPINRDEYNIKLKFNINLIDCSFMFAGCKKIKNINFINFNTEYIKNMKYMFTDCQNLKNLNLFLFDTQNVNDMNHLFYGCNNLTNIDLSSFDTRNVIDMSYMFYGCINLEEVDLSKFNTKNVMNLSNFLYDCQKLKYINLSSFDTSNITDMSSMFCGCENLSCLDLSNFNTENISDMNNMFKLCKNLENLNLTSFNTNKVINMSGLFYECYNLTNIDLFNFETENLKNMSNMFYSCTRLKNIDLSTFDTRNVTNMNKMFYGCKELSNINLFYPNLNNQKYLYNKFYNYFGNKNDNSSKFETKNVKDMSGLFNGCESLENIDLSKFDTENVKNMSGLFYDCKNLKNINLSSFNTKRVINMNGLFHGCENLKNINLSNFDTKNVKNLSELFYNCKNLKNINISSFDTKKVIDMSGLFYGCENLNNIDLKAFNTNKVSNLNNMFYNCKNLINLDLSHFDTKNVKNISNMFHGCENLKNIDLSNFSTENLVDMSGLFYGCKNLKNINISSFDTKNVTNMSEIFHGCENLEFIDLSNFDIKNVSNMRGLFNCCANLTNVNLSNFDSTNVTDMNYIFHGCKNLTDSNLTFLFNEKVGDISNMFFNSGIFNNIDFAFFSDNIINYSCEFVFKFKSTIKLRNNENYLINKIKSFQFLNKKGDFIKIKNKIIIKKENEQYIINLVTDNEKADCTLIEYDLNDIECFKDIHNLLNNNNIHNIYLIGVNFSDNEEINMNEILKLSESYIINNYFVSSKKDNDIKNLLNDLFLHIRNVEISCKDIYEIIFFPCSSYNVGKTSLIKRINDDKFSDSYQSTIDLDYFSKKIHLKTGKVIKMHFWDFGGGVIEMNINMAFDCLKGCDCAILMFDVGIRESFDELKNLYFYYMDNFNDMKLKYLIGNKIDLILNNENERKVSKKEALEFAKENNWRYFELSCKDNIGIKEFNIDLINEIIKIKKENKKQ